MVKKSAKQGLRERGSNTPAEIADSVVCLRGFALYEARIPDLLALDGLDGLHILAQPRDMEFLRHLSSRRWHGTGVVIERDDRGRAIILTNAHVAAAAAGNTHLEEMCVYGSILREHGLSVVPDRYNSETGSHIPLEVIALSVDSDAALVRTLEPSSLQVCPASLQAPGEGVRVGQRVLTVGYPLGEHKIVARGEIIATDVLDIELTPYPNRHHLVNIPIDPGQSGSPVIVRDGRTRTHHIIGLVYGGASGLDTVKMVTPVSGFSAMLSSHQDIPSKRPRLGGEVDLSLLESAILPGTAPAHVNLLTKSLMLSRRRGGGYLLREYALSGSQPMLGNYVDWHVDATGSCQSIYVCYSGSRTKHSVPKDLQKFADRVAKARIHYVAGAIRHGSMNGFEKTSDDARSMAYMAKLMNDQMITLEITGQILGGELYSRNIVPRRVFI